MDKKQGRLNVAVAVGFKIILLVGLILVRRAVIRYLGTEINGLNSLYLSIVGFLSIADMGIGTAIVYCMYKPIVEGDKQKVIALYRLIEKLYKLIGAVIFGAGIIVMFFLPVLAKGYSVPKSEMYVTFVIMLISVVLSYFFSAKVSLLEAYKNNYIATTFYSIATLVQYILQIAAVIIFKTFMAYLVCRIAAVLIQWVLIEIHARKNYGDIITQKAVLDKESTAEVVKNVKAIFMHKAGIMMVNTVDSIVISSFIGVVVLGRYTNYSTIATSMTSILMLFFTPLTSVIGHYFASSNNDFAIKYFNFFHAFNYILGTVFFLGYYAIIDDLVYLFFGDGLKIAGIIVFIITYNYFIQFMRNAVVLFRDASGTFYYDRWKGIIEGVVNIILSIGFVLIFPEEYKVVGVIAATIITNLFISHIVEPFVLFRYGMKRPLCRYYVRNYVWMAAFGGMLVLLDRIKVHMANRFAELLINGSIAVAMAAVVFALFMIFDKDFRYYFARLFKRGKNE